MLSAVPFSNSITPDALDAISNEHQVLMLPNSHHNPAGRTERRVVASITGNVRVELGTPPIGVRFWSYRMLRAAVPETAIDENNDPRPSQCDVRASRDISHVHSVPKPSAVQLMPKCQLRSGPLSSEARHEATYSRARRLGLLGAARLGSHR